MDELFIHTSAWHTVAECVIINCEALGLIFFYETFPQAASSRFEIRLDGRGGEDLPDSFRMSRGADNHRYYFHAELLEPLTQSHFSLK
jgi:hypothetical protein